MKPYFDDGQCVIYHGDCREVLPALPEKPDLILTDPPYGIGAARMTLGNGRKIIYRGDVSWDDAPADIAPLLAFGIPAVVWGGNHFNVPPARCWLVWDKGTGDNDYADCELAWTNRDGVVKKFTRSWVGANAREQFEGDRLHPTQKPLALMRWCLGFYPEAALVLDPFMGSGSTLVAAKQLEERYCEIAAKRLSQQTLGLEVA